jgi:hypothetical protein
MHFYMVYTRLGSPGNHLYAFLHGVHSPGLPWGAFVCIFTWCTLAWAPLGAICMHFYVVCTRVESPGGYLYAFLHGVHAPELPWEAFVCIFSWCTFAWTPLGAIRMHVYMVYIRLGSPGDHVYAANRASQLTQLASQPSHPASPATSPASSHLVTQPAQQLANQPTGSPLTREPLVGFYSREGGYL